MAFFRLIGLAGLLVVCVSMGLSLVHERQANLQTYRMEVERLSAEVESLTEELAEAKNAAARLSSDSLAWEEVARERMGYLVRGEVLVTWTQ